MDELLRSLSRFLSRDAIFILGGATVVVSFGYFLGVPTIDHIPTPGWVLIAGLCYAVGWAVQDLFCLAHIATTANYFEPNRVARFVFKRYQRVEWCQPACFEPDIVRTKVDFAPNSVHARLERFITLKLLGMTMGPCTLVAATFLVARAVRGQAVSDWYLAIAAAVFAPLFLALGWVKACEQLRYMAYLNLILPTKEPIETA